MFDFRKAKRKLDNRSFFGGILHIAYAPEFETVEETREKLIDRRRVVERKIKCMSQIPLVFVAILMFSDNPLPLYEGIKPRLTSFLLLNISPFVSFPG